MCPWSWKTEHPYSRAGVVGEHYDWMPKTAVFPLSLKPESVKLTWVSHLDTWQPSRSETVWTNWVTRPECIFNSASLVRSWATFIKNCTRAYTFGCDECVCYNLVMIRYCIFVQQYHFDGTNNNNLPWCLIRKYVPSMTKTQENVSLWTWLFLVTIVSKVKEIYKLKKYTDHRLEVVRMWDVHAITLPVIIGTSGSIPEKLKNLIGKISLKPSLQKYTLLTKKVHTLRNSSKPEKETITTFFSTWTVSTSAVTCVPPMVSDIPKSFLWGREFLEDCPACANDKTDNFSYYLIRFSNLPCKVFVPLCILPALPLWLLCHLLLLLIEIIDLTRPIFCNISRRARFPEN